MMCLLPGLHQKNIKDIYKMFLKDFEDMMLLCIQLYVNLHCLKLTFYVIEYIKMISKY